MFFFDAVKNTHICWLANANEHEKRIQFFGAVLVWCGFTFPFTPCVKEMYFNRSKKLKSLQIQLLKTDLKSAKNNENDFCPVLQFNQNELKMYTTFLKYFDC